MYSEFKASQNQNPCESKRFFSKSMDFLKYLYGEKKFRNAKCHLLYTSVFSDKSIYPRKICKIENKQKLHVNFSNYLLAYYHFATLYNSNVFTLLVFYLFFSSKLTRNIYLKIPKYGKPYQNFTQALLAMLVTFFNSEKKS